MSKNVIISVYDKKDLEIISKYLIEKKYISLKDKNPFTKKKKTAAYLYNKGYESDLIWKHLNDCY